MLFKVVQQRNAEKSGFYHERKTKRNTLVLGKELKNSTSDTWRLYHRRRNLEIQEDFSKICCFQTVILLPEIQDRRLKFNNKVLLPSNRYVLLIQ